MIRVYTNITQIENSDSLQTYLNLWAINNTMLYNHHMFNYISFSSSMSSINTNLYDSPSLDIINPSVNVLDLGIIMSRNCSFDVHINILCKKCTDLSGWILRTFTSRDSTTLRTLFNALILSRLDYCSQLWSAHLIRHIIQIENVQRSFTKCINGMDDCSYSDRLSLLRLYSLQR